MVLGREADGSEDCVIEVNPRLTTSYVGLRAATRSNLADVMLRVSQGESASVDYLDRGVEFDSSGNVSFVR
jgi:predicted ATP-grasp superfamily ATP-dependent carboligase